MKLELQTDSDMEARIVRYHVDLHLEYRLPVISVILYLFNAKMPEPPYKELSGHEKLMVVEYRVIALWELDARHYIQQHALYKYTFLPAMARASVELLKQAIQEMKARYNPQQFAKHLSRFKTILQRSRTLSEEEKQAVEEYMQVYDSLIDNDPYFQRRLEEKSEERAQELAKQRERALQKQAEKLIREVEERAARAAKEAEEMKEAMEREAQGMRQLVVEVVEDRFPSLVELARKQVAVVKQPDMLRQLVRFVLKAPDEAMVNWLLSSLSA